jgi:hypothetical protein
MKNKSLKSTYDELMESMDSKEKENYDAELKDFLVSELILAAMEDDNMSVRKLAKLAGVSPTIVQEMRTPSQKGFNTKTLFKVLKQLGYNFLLERNGKLISLDLNNMKK